MKSAESYPEPFNPFHVSTRLPKVNFNPSHRYLVLPRCLYPSKFSLAKFSTFSCYSYHKKSFNRPSHRLILRQNIFYFILCVGPLQRSGECNWPNSYYRNFWRQNSTKMSPTKLVQTHSTGCEQKPLDAVLSGYLSPRHDASSACTWRRRPSDGG